MRRGTTFETTEINPSAPSASMGTVISSSPESTANPSGRPTRMSVICGRLPEASFVATKPPPLASSSVVDASMLQPVRLGTLYRTIGRPTASAIARKCKIMPRCGGLLYIGATCRRCVAPASRMASDSVIAFFVSLEPAPHGEDPAPPDQPPRGHERSFGKHPAIARLVHETHLLEGRVEDHLVRARHGAGANARDGNGAPERRLDGASERTGRTGGRV